MSDGEEVSLSIDENPNNEEAGEAVGRTHAWVASGGASGSGLVGPSGGSEPERPSTPSVVSSEDLDAVSWYSEDDDDAGDAGTQGTSDEKIPVSAISDPAAKHFWETRWGPKTEVGFEEFSSALESYFSGYFKDASAFKHDILAARFIIENLCVFVIDDFELDLADEMPGACLRYKKPTDWQIGTTEFDNFLKRFGPFSKCMENVVSSVFPVDFFGMPAPWFHGTLGAEQVDSVMRRNMEPGMFMITYDPDHNNGFLLHFTDDSGVHVVREIAKLDHRLDTSNIFTLQGDSRLSSYKEHYPSLHKLVEALQKQDVIKDFITSHVYYRLDQRLTDSKKVLGGDIAQMTLEEIESLLLLAFHNAENLEGAVIEDFRKRNAYSMHLLFWIALSKRVKKLLKETMANSRRALARQAQTAVQQLNKELKSASSRWTDGEYCSYVDEQELYENMIELSEALSKHDRLYSAERGGSDIREVQQRMFWYRYFGPTEVDVPIEVFGSALALFLQSEYSRLDVDASILTKVISKAVGENGDQVIQLDEWKSFMERFGPLEECYDRAKSVCTAEIPDSNKLSDAKVEFVDWFRFFGRESAQRVLTNHEKGRLMRDYPKSHFYIRHGRGDTHAFTLTFRPKPGAMFENIRIHNKPKNGELVYQIGEEETDRNFSNLTELMDYVFGELKWTEAPPTLEDWSRVENKVLVANEAAAATSSQMQLKKLIKYFDQAGLATMKELEAIIPEKARSMGSDVQLQVELHTIMEGPLETSLKGFLAFCDFSGPDGEGRKSVLKKYRRGRIGLDVVEHAIRDERWIGALPHVADADPKLLSIAKPEVYKLSVDPSPQKVNALGVVEEEAEMVRVEDELLITPAQLAIRLASKCGWKDASSSRLTVESFRHSSPSKNMVHVLTFLFQQGPWRAAQNAESDTESDEDSEYEHKADEEDDDVLPPVYQRPKLARLTTKQRQRARQWSLPAGWSFVGDHELYDLMLEAVLGLNMVAMELVFKWSFHDEYYNDALVNKVKAALLGSSGDKESIFHVLASYNSFAEHHIRNMHVSDAFVLVADMAKRLMLLLRRLRRAARKVRSLKTSYSSRYPFGEVRETQRAHIPRRTSTGPEANHGRTRSGSGFGTTSASSEMSQRDDTTENQAFLELFTEHLNKVDLTPVTSAAAQKPANKHFIIALIREGHCSVECTVSTADGPLAESQALAGAEVTQHHKDDNLLHLMMADKTWWLDVQATKLLSEDGVRGRFRPIINKSNADEETPLCSLMNACLRDDDSKAADLAVWLIEEGALVDGVVKSGRRSTKMLQAMIASYMASSAENNWHLMQLTVRNGDQALLKLLIDGNLPIGVPPLMFSHKKGKDRRGNIRIDRSEYLLHLAVGPDSKAGAAMIKTLLEYRPEREPIINRLNQKADDLARNLRIESQGYAGIHVGPTDDYETSKDYHAKAVARLFIPDPEFYDKNKQTALHILAAREPIASKEEEDEKIGELLLTSMPAIQKDRFGMTALHYAALHNNDALAKSIILAQIDPSEITDEGNTALHIAAKCGHWALVNLLMKEMGAKSANLRNNEGYTPLSLALQRKRHLVRLQKVRETLRTQAGLQRGDADLRDKGQLFRRLSEFRLSSTRSVSVKSGFLASSRTAPKEYVRPAGGGNESLRDPSTRSSPRAPEDDKAVRWGAETENPSEPEAGRRPSTVDPPQMEMVPLSEKLEREKLPPQRVKSIMDKVPDFYECRLRDAEECAKRLDNMNEDKETVVVYDLLKAAYKERAAVWNEMREGGNTVLSALLQCEGEDLAKLLRDYDTTIRIILKQDGVSMEMATEIPGLDAILNVDAEWTSLSAQVEHLTHSSEPREVSSTASTKEDSRPLHDGHTPREPSHANKSRAGRAVASARAEELMDELWENPIHQCIVRAMYERRVRPIHLLRLVVYLIFVGLLTAVAFVETSLDKQSAFYVQDGLVESLIHNEYPERLGTPLRRDFVSIDDKSEWYMWLNGPFLDVIYPNGTVPVWAESDLKSRPPGFINDHIRLVGVPRFRQLRGRETECAASGELSNRSRGAALCTSPATKPDRRSFGPGGAWTFQDDTDTPGMWGHTGWYPGFGHVVAMPSVVQEGARQSALNLFAFLEQNHFVDAMTRVVIVEFSGVNLDEHFFVSASILAEFPRAGGVVVSWNFDVQRLKTFSTTWDLNVEIVLLMLLGCVLLFRGVSMLLGNTNTRARTAVESFIFVGVVVALTMRFVNYRTEAEIDWDITSDFLPTLYLSRLVMVETQIMSFVVFVCWINILPYLSVSEEGSRFITLIGSVLWRIRWFALVLVIVLMAFSSAEFVAYGFQFESTSTFVYTLLTRLSLAFSGRVIDTSVDHTAPLHVVYSTIFVLLVSLLLVNLLIAVLSHTYETVVKLGAAVHAKQQYAWITKERDSGALSSIRHPENKLLRVVTTKSWRMEHKLDLEVDNEMPEISEMSGTDANRESDDRSPDDSAIEVRL